MSLADTSPALDDLNHPADRPPHPDVVADRLGRAGAAIYATLFDRAGRVVSRAELARAAGIADLGPRRCDALMVDIRRLVGAERLVTVRRRGWMLAR